MTTHLPQVLEFSHLYNVKLETHDGYSRIVATPATKYKQNYKHARDLPFVLIKNDGERPNAYWFYSKPASNHSEACTRGDYFWEEFVRFVRGPQKRRRNDAIWLADQVVRHLYAYKDCETESSVFSKHLAEALIAHLRVGLDEGKTDQQLTNEG